MKRDGDTKGEKGRHRRRERVKRENKRLVTRWLGEGGRLEVVNRKGNR
jgi:hypothetical protein